MKKIVRLDGLYAILVSKQEHHAATEHRPRSSSFTSHCKYSVSSIAIPAHLYYNVIVITMRFYS